MNFATPALAVLLAAGADPAPSAVPPADREDVRLELTDLLERFPPELGVVFKLDPELMQNATYLAPYPELSAFLAAHPEVPRQPQFYLAHVPSPFEVFREGPSERIAMNVLGGLAGITVFVVLTGVLAWLVKTILAQRRWAQIVRNQTEAHNKLLDRMTGSDDLLAYLQSPSGRRFLEAAPLLAEEPPSPKRSPFGRILGSVQAGVVLASGGAGLRLVASTLGGEGAVAIASIGNFVLALGVGFVVSAGVSFFLSRRLGLWPRAGESESRA